MQNWIMDIIESYGYIGVFLLIMLENIFPPIPSEVILTFSGFMTVSTSLTTTGVVIASTLGSVVGAIALYGIGTLLNAERLSSIITKWGHLLRLRVEDVTRTQKWFDKYGIWTVFFCRFIPLIRSLISIPAGMAKMNIGAFFLFTTLGTVLWNFALIQTGAILGDSWETVLHYMEYYSTFIYIGIAIAICAIIIFIWKRNKKYKHGV
ncbi:MAG: DedA family protein [Bacilli bacterium]